MPDWCVPRRDLALEDLVLRAMIAATRMIFALMSFAAIVVVSQDQAAKAAGPASFVCTTTHLKLLVTRGADDIVAIRLRSADEELSAIDLLLRNARTCEKRAFGRLTSRSPTVGDFIDAQSVRIALTIARDIARYSSGDSVGARIEIVRLEHEISAMTKWARELHSRQDRQVGHLILYRYVDLWRQADIVRRNIDSGRPYY